MIWWVTKAEYEEIIFEIVNLIFEVHNSSVLVLYLFIYLHQLNYEILFN